jgi:7-keto-8-aminopelargonate synthetase-like enzyme
MWRISLTAFNVVRGMAVERARILALAETFRNGLHANGVRTSGQFHITGVHIPVVKARGFEVAMRRAGYYLKVSQYPTRPIGDPCARVCFTPKHTISDAADLSKTIVKVLKK